MYECKKKKRFESNARPHTSYLSSNRNIICATVVLERTKTYVARVRRRVRTVLEQWKGPLHSREHPRYNNINIRVCTFLTLSLFLSSATFASCLVSMHSHIYVYIHTHMHLYNYIFIASVGASSVTSVPAPRPTVEPKSFILHVVTVDAFFHHDFIYNANTCHQKKKKKNTILKRFYSS